MLRIPGVRWVSANLLSDRYKPGARGGPALFASDFIGAACVSIGITLIVGTIFTYFHEVLPLLIVPEGWPWWITLGVTTWLSFNLMFNYCMVLMTKPGRSHVSMMREEDVQAAYEHKKDPKIKGLWCRKCDAPRAPRAHHCPLCGYCVLKMDHHCPWVNQCVGHHNHKYFVLMLVYIWSSVTWAVVTIGLNYFGFLRNAESSKAARDHARQSIAMCFVICISLCIIMSMFVWWTLKLVMQNETTIEYLTNSTGKTVNIYSYGAALKNLRVLFGATDSYIRMLMPSIAPPDGGGHAWNMPCASENRYIANYQATGSYKIPGERPEKSACCAKDKGEHCA